MTLTILVSVIGVMPASYAQEQGFSFAQPDFLFIITTWIENVRLGFASQTDKIELIREFAFDKQTRIDQALLNGESISLAVEDRRKALVNQAESLGAITSFREKLDTASEYNNIRILYSQFPDCLENCTDAEKRMFNDKVNSLDSWKQKCSGEFDIDNYDHTDISFDKLSQLCPELKDFTKDKLKLLVRVN